MSKTNFLWKCESLLFVLFVFFTAAPILANAYFPTVDGPAHLHNGNLLKHAWFLNDDFIKNFFEFNSQLNSNILDHVWFAFFGLFLPANLVEKSILIFYAFSLPFSFRYLAKQITSNEHSARIASYLIFPFVYTFTFQLGFLNFSIGIPILLWTLGLWIKNREQLNTKKIILIASLSTIVYLSHVFNFMLLGIILFINEIQYIIHSKTIKGIIKKMIPAGLILLPGLILAILFVISNSNFKHDAPNYIDKIELVQMLIDLRPLITLSYPAELDYAHIILYSICILGILVIIDYFRKRKKEKTFRIYWLASALVILVLYFTFPDWMGSGGFISFRWLLFFFLLIIILIAAKALPVKQLLIPVISILVTHSFFVKYHYDQTKALSDDAATLAEAEKYMETNKVLLPLNYSSNWIQMSHAGYMAATKNIICLDNYEPCKPHFPLIWKEGENVFDLMKYYGNRNPPCININVYEQKTKHRIDYLSRFYFNGDVTDSCTILVEKEIQARFELIYKSENNKLELYKRKQGT